MLTREYICFVAASRGSDGRRAGHVVRRMSNRTSICVVAVSEIVAGGEISCFDVWTELIMVIMMLPGPGAVTLLLLTCLIG